MSSNSKFYQIGPRAAELGSIELLLKSSQTYDRIHFVNTPIPSFLTGSS